jgi:sec-independent protein translocase protein TatA
MERAERAQPSRLNQFPSRSKAGHPIGLDNPIHILLLLLVVLLVFGAKRLPEIGRSLGDGMRGFKDSLQGETHRSSMLDDPTRASVSVSVAPTAPVAVPTAYVDPAELAGTDR